MSDSILVKILAVIVTLLCCYAFYQLRTSAAREQSFGDAVKVIQAASEIVSSLAEKGIPGLRTRLDELESKGRILEQNQRRMTTTPHQSQSQPQQLSDAEILAARRASLASAAQKQ